MQAKEIIKFYHFGKLELNKLIACQRNAKLYTVQGVSRAACMQYSAAPQIRENNLNINSLEHTDDIPVKVV